MTRLDLADIQGNVVRGYRFPVAEYVFIAVTDTRAGQGWLQSMIGHVTNAEPWDEKPGWAFNLAFSHGGLRALDVSEDSLASFPVEFRAGMRAGAETLGDTGTSAPRYWERPISEGSAHVMAVVHAQTAEQLRARRDWLERSVDTCAGLEIVGRQRVGRLAAGREHFGYVDGLSQPRVEGDGSRLRPGHGVTDRSGGWRALRAGEFLLGHRDETGVPPDAPRPAALARNGTYLVYRKLRQDVALFRRFLAEHGRSWPGGEERLAAALMGRWRDGACIEQSPQAPDPLLGADPERNNDFTFSPGYEDARCPVGAHIRRANPRAGMGFSHKLVHRHRLIRRGMPYGDPLPQGADDDGRDRGLVFVCLCASISRQFEFVQSQWLNDGSIFGLGADKDVFAGDNDGTGKMTVHGRPPWFVPNIPRFVSTRGGEYFFLPGIGALHHIAGQRADGRHRLASPR